MMTTSQHRSRQPRMKLPSWLPFTLALIGFVGLIIVSLLVGVYDLSSDEFGAELFWITRVPRTVALVLAACAMSVAGLVMQMLTQNRFVEPTTTGVTEWAGLGLLTIVMIFPPATILTRMVVASVFAFFGTMVFMFVLRRLQLHSSLIVPLVGIMLGAVVSAFTTYVAISANLSQMLGSWFTGSFSGVVRGRYEPLWIVAIVFLVIWIVADRFTAAGLGKDIATSVGLKYEQVVFFGTVLVAIVSGVTTVVVGFLPFVGLIVPNIVSLVRGDNLRSNIPWVCLTGGALIIICDVIGRLIKPPTEVPVSMVLGIFGAMIFLVLLLRRNRGK